MTKIISAQYYSKNLSKKIKDLIGSCHLCQIFKSHNTRSPPISPGEFPSHPMQTLSLDYFSVPPSHGFKYILLAIDRFSGYIFTKPCKNESADDVCEFLETIFSQAGPAITVTSDGGSTLTKNKKVKDLLSKWGVQKISTSLPYSPIHNSKAERAIRAFRHLMRVSSPDKLHGWFKICKRITYLMNSTPRVFKLKDKIEIFSPFELFLRRPPLPFSINTALIKDPTAKSQLLLEKEQIKKTDEFVIKYLKKQNEVYHENFNKNTKTPQFKVGDMVLLKHLTPPAQGQLPQKYKSPYKKQLYIVKFTSDNLTVLLDPITGNVSYQNQGDFARALFVGETPTLFYHPNKVVSHAMLSQICPLAFPFGTGDVECRRRPEVSEIECLQHYLKLSLPQFLEGQTVLVIHHMYQRRKSFLSGIAKCNVSNNGNTIANQLAAMTVEELDIAITQMKMNATLNNSEITTYSPRVTELLKCVKTSCAPIGYTNEAASEARNKMFALWMTFGPPSLLFTFSPCDECSFRMQLHATAEYHNE